MWKGPNNFCRLLATRQKMGHFGHFPANMVLSKQDSMQQTEQQTWSRPQKIQHETYLTDRNMKPKTKLKKITVRWLVVWTLTALLTQFRSCRAFRSFVRSIRGGSRLLTVFRRAFSHHQRWGLGLAQCASPLTLGLALYIYRAQFSRRVSLARYQSAVVL